MNPIIATPSQIDPFVPAPSEELARLWGSACVTAGKITHDFRNFFNIVLGFTSLSTELVTASSQVAQYLREIDGGCVQGREYLDQLSVLACSEKSGSGLCSIREVVHEEIRRFRGRVSRKVTFTDSQDDIAPICAIDSTSMGICLQQVLMNAAEATRVNDLLRISSGQVDLSEADLKDSRLFGRMSPGTFGRISIAENGTGISAELLPKLLRVPFISEKRHRPGVGLGIVFLKMWHCGGGMRIESEPGSETRIDLFVPLARAAAMPPDAPLR